MKISIIIPIFKVEAFIEKCLRSCLHQDISNTEYEIICVNDGSPDRSLEVVERVSKDYQNIIIVSQENQGLSCARNRGLSLAKGDYVWFVDSDDWIEKDILKMLVTLCTENDLDILHFCAANVIDGEPVRRFNYEGREKNIIKGKDALLEGIHSPCAPFSIYRRKFLLENNLSFYPGIFHEDSEFTPRAWYMAKRVMLLDDVCYYVYQSPNSITRAVNPKKAFDLIKVCESLDKFCENVEDKYKIYFHNDISMYINNSLYNSYSMNSIDIKRLNSVWGKYSYLFKHLKLSSPKKYRLEYHLFRVFPFYCQVYKLIQHLNKK